MVAKNACNADPKPTTYRVTRNGRELTLSYQQMFEAGYQLLLAKNYAESSRVFGLLSRVSDRGPHAHLMLAFCQAQLRDYTACSQTLNQAFEEDSSNLESSVHGAFVFWACGLYHDARSEMEMMIKENPQLPTFSLLLGDLLSQSGNRTQPPRLWQLAVKNDRRDGAVGLIAKRKLEEWTSRRDKSSSN